MRVFPLVSLCFQGKVIQTYPTQLLGMRYVNCMETSRPNRCSPSRFRPRKRCFLSCVASTLLKSVPLRPILIRSGRVPELSLSTPAASLEGSEGSGAGAVKGAAAGLASLPRMIFLCNYSAEILQKPAWASSLVQVSSCYTQVIKDSSG